MKRVWPVLVVVLGACNSQKAAPPASPPAASQPTATITATSTSPQAVEHFRKGEQLFDNARTAEAAAEFDEALRADPPFPLARAFRAFVKPDAEGMKGLDQAVRDAARLPEAERRFVEALVAATRGDLKSAEAAFVRLAEAAPRDWRAHEWLGTVYSLEQKYPEAVAAYTKATELNPDAGVAQNGLGYAALQQGDAAGAAAAFREYARVMPQEPNAQDSLGEALMAAGQFAEAEAAFQKAVALSPQFWIAHQGMAYARIYAGDWAGGRAALEKAKEAAPLPVEKIGVDEQLATVALAQRDTRTALAITEAMARTPGARPADLAFVPVSQARALNAAGRYGEALKRAGDALAQAGKVDLAPGQARALKGTSLIEKITAEAGLHDAAAAAQTSATIDALAAEDVAFPSAQSAAHFGRGMLAVVKGQTAEARTHFDKCISADVDCKWQGLLAAEKAGDKAGSAAARAALLKLYLRNPRHLLVRARLAPQTSPATAGSR